MNKAILGVSLVLSGNFIASVSQVILKMAASKNYSSRVRALLNAKVILAYGLFFSTTILTIFALRYIPITMCAALEATGQIFVPLMSCVCLGEKISKKRFLGMTLIVLGIVIFSI